MQNMTAFNIEEDDPANNAIKRAASRERRRSRVASWQHVGVGRPTCASRHQRQVDSEQCDFTGHYSASEGSRSSAD